MKFLTKHHLLSKTEKLPKTKQLIRNNPTVQVVTTSDLCKECTVMIKIEIIPKIYLKFEQITLIKHLYEIKIKICGVVDFFP